MLEILYKILFVYRERPNIVFIRSIKIAILSEITKLNAVHKSREVYIYTLTLPLSLTLTLTKQVDLICKQTEEMVNLTAAYEVEKVLHPDPDLKPNPYLKPNLNRETIFANSRKKYKS